MSTLNEEVARLKQAKTNIAAAITGKGVEIPAGALLDTYDDYIHQIEVGSTVEGVTSANVTAKRSDVAKGVTTVTSDSYDAIVEGTLELVGTATEEKVLMGESFYNNNLYEKSTGTMPNNGSVTAILNAGECYKVPLGYHDGEGLIQAADLQSQTQGTATVEKILIGETATVNGEPLVGTMPNNGAVAPSSLGAGGSYVIPEGYHNGGGIVNVKSLAELTADGDATAAQILSGKKAYVDGSLLTGTLAIQSAISFSAAAQSASVIRISWKNPSKGPWTGVKIRMSTSGNPGVSGGTLKYTGTGSSKTAGATSYVDITGLTPGTKYYFTCYSYVTGLGDSSTGTNVTTTTKGLLIYDNGNNAYGLAISSNKTDQITFGSTYITFNTNPGLYMTKTVDLSKYTKFKFDLMFTKKGQTYINILLYNNDGTGSFPDGDTSQYGNTSGASAGLNTRTTLTTNITKTGVIRPRFDILSVSSSTGSGSTGVVNGKIYRIWLE